MLDQVPSEIDRAAEAFATKVEEAADGEVTNLVIERVPVYQCPKCGDDVYGEPKKCGSCASA